MSLRNTTSLLHPQSPAEQSGISPKLLQFLNNLPTDGSDIVQWIKVFREELQRFLVDVNWISISVNTVYGYQYKLDGEHQDWTLPSNRFDVTMSVGNRPQIEINADQYDLSNMTMEDFVRTQANKLLDQMKSRGFPFDKYQPPHCCYYYDQQYLGTIFLFRYRGSLPISSRIVATMEALRPFIHFVLSDATARYAHAHPAHPIFFDEVISKIADCEFSVQERDTFVLRLLGYKLSEIAAKLDMSIPYVKKQLQNIRKKTGARHGIELLTRLLAPDLEGMVEAGMPLIEEETRRKVNMTL